MALKRFGVSLDDALLEQLDGFVVDNGFANRSQAIKFLVEKNLAEQKWQCNHIVAGTVFVVYGQERSDIRNHIADIELQYQSYVMASSQYYKNNGICLHVSTVYGEAYKLTELADRLVSIKGIRHGKLLMSRAE